VHFGRVLSVKCQVSREGRRVGATETAGQFLAIQYGDH
jgi:hypothetical protein